MKSCKGIMYEVIDGLKDEVDLNNIKEVFSIIKNSQFEEEFGKIEYVIIRVVEEDNILVDIIWRNYVVCVCDRLEINTFYLEDILEEKELFIKYIL